MTFQRLYMKLKSVRLHLITKCIDDPPNEYRNLVLDDISINAMWNRCSKNHWRYR